MNYLAHAYLSFNDPHLTIGNMIADFVKGKQILGYEEGIQEGIRLHRAIDSFTDRHPATARAKQLLKPAVGLYSAVFIDVVYDHFLARDQRRFTDTHLSYFAQEVYHLLQSREEVLPATFRQVFYFMRTQNWLYHYRRKEGIYKTFNGVVRRARYLEVPAELPFNAFETHYAELESCYHDFFPQLEGFVKNEA
jgi:acyl carrier protein phosphodiesterase